MKNSLRQISLGFSSDKRWEGQHICDIFNDENERQRTMAKYLGNGLEAGEKVLYLVDTMTTEEFTDSMEQLGLDIRGREKDFVLSEAMPVYCANERFSTPDMLDVVGSFYQPS